MGDGRIATFECRSLMCLTQFRANVTFIDVRTQNIIEFPYHSVRSRARLVTDSNVHAFVWEFRFYSLKFSNRTTFHYAVDVRQPRLRSTKTTTTTTMASPDINIGFYTFCVAYVLAKHCWPANGWRLCAMRCHV